MERVAEFNSKYPVGSEVHWRRANGTMTDATVRNAAEVKRGLGAVVWLDGIAGPKSLDRIEEAR
jgi:hypothetical protein